MVSDHMKSFGMGSDPLRAIGGALPTPRCAAWKFARRISDHEPSPVGWASGGPSCLGSFCAKARAGG